MTLWRGRPVREVTLWRGRPVREVTLWRGGPVRKNDIIEKWALANEYKDAVTDPVIAIRAVVSPREQPATSVYAGPR